MTLREVIHKNEGNVVGDGQCVALYRKDIGEVWGLPALECLGSDGGAEGLVTRYDTDVCFCQTSNA